MEHDLFIRLARARDLLAESGGRPVRLEDAARCAHLSKFHFLRLFEQAFGETPHAFAQRQRIDRARTLLVREDLPVTEVCFEVGYSSLGSFSALFRRMTGESPVEFRRRARPVFAVEWSAGPLFIPMCYVEQFTGFAEAPQDSQFSRSAGAEASAILSA